MKGKQATAAFSILVIAALINIGIMARNIWEISRLENRIEQVREEISLDYIGRLEAYQIAVGLESRIDQNDATLLIVQRLIREEIGGRE